jgi:hypothetical protein
MGIILDFVLQHQLRRTIHLVLMIMLEQYAYSCPTGYCKEIPSLMRPSMRFVNMKQLTHSHHTLIMHAQGSLSSSPDKIPILRKIVAYPGSEGPVVGLQNMSAKFPSRHKPSRLVIPLDASLNRRMRPVAPNVPGYSRKKISRPVTKCISQRRKRAKLDFRAMRYFKLGKCWAVQLGNFLIVLLRRQDHPLFKHLSIDTRNGIGAPLTLIKYTNMTAMPNLDAVSMPLIRAHSSATK